MKKVMALLLAAIMVLALAACGKKEPDPSGDTPGGSQSSNTTMEDPATSPLKDNWGKEDNMSTANTEYITARYYISYPYYVGVQQITGNMADQGDGSLVLVDSQVAKSVVPESLKDVFPAWFEQEEKNVSLYYDITCKEYQFELTSKKETKINDKEMVKYEGKLSYLTYKNEPKSSQWVAYAVKVEKNDTYACWMVFDISDDQSKGNLIEEHALNMAKSFREE